MILYFDKTEETNPIRVRTFMCESIQKDIKSRSWLIPQVMRPKISLTSCSQWKQRERWNKKRNLSHLQAELYLISIRGLQLPKKNFSQGKSLYKAPLRKTSLEEEQKLSLEETPHYSFSRCCFKALWLTAKPVRSGGRVNAYIYSFLESKCGILSMHLAFKMAWNDITPNFP